MCLVSPSALPADGAPMIDVAIRSNELYRHVEGRVRAAVRFLGEAGMRYMLGGEARPTLSADDVTGAAATIRCSFLRRPTLFTPSRATSGKNAR